MRIAFLISAHDNPAHLHKLLKRLSHPEHYLFLHIDKKSSLNPSDFLGSNVTVLKDRKLVNWGGFSQVEATISLITSALKQDKFDHFVYLSGADYPLRSNKYIQDFLMKNKGKEFLNICKMPKLGKTFNRVEKYYFETSTKSPFFLMKRILNFISNLIPIKRRLPGDFKKYILFGGSSWWILSEAAVQYVATFAKSNTRFTEFYKHTLCPDEMFFQTIIGNSHFMENTLPAPFYSDFSKRGKNPELINSNHLKLLKNGKALTSYGETEFLFARKFNDRNSDITDMIDEDVI